MAIEVLQAVFIVALLRFSVTTSRPGSITVALAVGFGMALVFSPGETGIADSALRVFVAVVAADILERSDRHQKQPKWMLLIAALVIGVLVGWQVT